MTTNKNTCYNHNNSSISKNSENSNNNDDDDYDDDDDFLLQANKTLRFLDLSRNTFEENHMRVLAAAVGKSKSTVCRSVLCSDQASTRIVGKEGTLHLHI